MRTSDFDPACFVARLWLAFGLFALVALPAARSHDPLLGAMPFWLVVAPATVLLLRAATRSRATSGVGSRLGRRGSPRRALPCRSAS